MATRRMMASTGQNHRGRRMGGRVAAGGAVGSPEPSAGWKSRLRADHQRCVSHKTPASTVLTPTAISDPCFAAANQSIYEKILK